jgi:hypothetical protein
LLTAVSELTIEATPLGARTCPAEGCGAVVLPDRCKVALVRAAFSTDLVVARLEQATNTSASAATAKTTLLSVRRLGR